MFQTAPAQEWVNLHTSTLSRPSLPLAQSFPTFSLPTLAEDAQGLRGSLGTFEVLGNPSKDPVSQESLVFPISAGRREDDLPWSCL